MTIAISLKVNDGLVLAADSASTLVTRNPDGTAGVVNVYNNANKVFNLIKGLPVGLVTWGVGSIGNASISTIVKDLRSQLVERIHRDNYTMEEVAQTLRELLFEGLYTPAFREWEEKPSLGLIVAGYSSRGSMGEEYQIDLTNGECVGPRAVRRPEEAGITWGGEGEAIHRLILGFGSGLPIVFERNLGVPAEQVQPTIDILRQALSWPLVVPAMPLQDAIDLAEFLVDLTIKFSRFSQGAPTVGGPIEIAVISKHEHFKWIRRKHYYSPELNPLGG